MYRIIISAPLFDTKYEAIITDTQLKEINLLLENSKVYRLETIQRLENGTMGEEIIDLLRADIKPDDLEEGKEVITQYLGKNKKED